MSDFTSFITGVSGVGKTTALRRLAGADPDFALRDIDEAGVPAGAGSAWRRERVAAWLSTAARLRREGRVPVLAGVVEPADVDDALPPGGELVPRFCLLDASDEVLAARLHGRLAEPGAAEDLLRVTGRSPERYLEDVTRHAVHLRQACAGRSDTVVVDTSSMSPAEVAATVGAWLRSR